MKAHHSAELERLRSDLEVAEACLRDERVKSTTEIEERVEHVCSEHRSKFCQAGCHPF